MFNYKVKKPLNVRMTKDDLQDLKSMYQEYYTKYPVPKGGTAELWYNIVIDFIQRKGWDVCRPELMELEDKILEMELTEKYVTSLNLMFTSSEVLADHEKLFLLITMGSDLRRETAIETLGILETR